MRPLLRLKTLLRVRFLAKQLFCICGLVMCGLAASPKTQAGKKLAPGTEFFQEPILRTFNIQLPESALTQLRGSPRSYVTGTITEGYERRHSLARSWEFSRDRREAQLRDQFPRV